jgi:phospholipid N-methyltransferase
VLAIEREPLFVQRLRQQWPRVESVCASAAALPSIAAERGLQPIDFIISGLPFASLPAAVTTEILDGIEHTLRPGGTFTTFQYVHAYRLPPAVAFRREISSRMKSAPSRTLVVKNLPPAYVLTWKRAASSEAG